MITLDFRKTLRTAAGSLKLDIQTAIADGKITALYGKSGEGKTTVLRTIAGLLSPDDGRIEVNEKCWFDSARRINLSPQKRSTGFVFQDYALFPNMTVREQIGFALRNKTNLNLVDKLLADTGLTDWQDAFPQKLSGGQKQRVALARALATESPLLLLDEPLSALDMEMRLQLQNLLLFIQRKYQTTLLLVSHDLTEVLRLADEVLLLKDGKIARQGAPAAVFDREFLQTYFQFLKPHL